MTSMVLDLECARLYLMEHSATAVKVSEWLTKFVAMRDYFLSVLLT